ncbi:hypothetical protein FIBSPDRAFT_970346 [Athelia psychrophila]|uniref:Uncharacterized protein n=1 Tax=Athelia psychrophila TaxID=1759441 RepID=A0A167SRE6_9AGAM|nr:hypothetical protein FIBSPDRAFT_970346 [Fibularhizoctonia sp. CBS 109695]
MKSAQLPDLAPPRPFAVIEWVYACQIILIARATNELRQHCDRTAVTLRALSRLYDMVAPTVTVARVHCAQLAMSFPGGPYASVTAKIEDPCMQFTAAHAIQCLYELDPL